MALSTKVDEVVHSLSPLRSLREGPRRARSPAGGRLSRVFTVLTTAVTQRIVEKGGASSYAGRGIRMRRLVRRPLLLGITVSAALAVAGGIAWAAIPDGNIVNACYVEETGELRAVGAATGCDSTTEKPVALGGPTRGYSTSRPEFALLGPTSVDLAQLILPEGSYIIHGKVNVANLNSTALGSTLVPCSLASSIMTDQSWVVLMSAVGGGLASSQTVSLQIAVTVPPGKKEEIRLRCASLPRIAGPATNVFGRYRQLSAIQVDALQFQ